MLALVLLFSSAFNPVETGLKEGKQAPMLKLKIQREQLLSGN